LTTSILSGPGTACMASTAARNAMKVAASGIYGLHPANAARGLKVRLLRRLRQLRRFAAMREQDPPPLADGAAGLVEAEREGRDAGVVDAAGAGLGQRHAEDVVGLAVE